jgi:hypothetical protein
MQDVRTLSEGVPGGSRHLGEKDTGSHPIREVYSLQVMYSGLQILGN